jgi:hypothetical protein
VSRTQQSTAAPASTPEQIRLDDDLRVRIAAHHERVNKRLQNLKTGIRQITRAELIRSLLRTALDAVEGTAEIVEP